LPAHERITYRIEIDPFLCNGCNNCTTACPVNARMRLGQGGSSITDERVIAIQNGVATVINPFKCDGDGICLLVCPCDCITIEFISFDDYNDIPAKVKKIVIED
jgi:ferredoxin